MPMMQTASLQIVNRASCVREFRFHKWCKIKERVTKGMMIKRKVIKRVIVLRYYPLSGAT